MADDGIAPLLKRCSKCQQTLPAGAFGRLRSAPDGLRPYCRACHCGTERARRAKDIDRERQRERAWRLKNLEQRIEQERRAAIKRRSSEGYASYLAERRYRQTEKLRAAYEQKPPIQCVVCGTPFKPPFGRQSTAHKVCSEDCSSALTKIRRTKKNGKRRAKVRGVEAEVIDALAVFERDRWKCQVCGVKTPKRFRGTFVHQAPELDHRVPLAMGGGHTWVNVQTACRACNLRKGGTQVLGQLPLWADPRAA